MALITPVWAGWGWGEDGSIQLTADALSFERRSCHSRWGWVGLGDKGRGKGSAADGQSDRVSCQPIAIGETVI